MSYLMPPKGADLNTIVKMYGSLTDPSKPKNRDVPLRDVIAFERAGFKRGSIPEPVEVVEEAVGIQAEPKRKKK